MNAKPFYKQKATAFIPIKGRRVFIVFCFFLFAALSFEIKAQNVSIKTNILGYTTTSMAVGSEIKLSSKISVDIMGCLNLWEFSRDRKMKHILIQPGVRYWFCEFSNGWFLGTHLHWAHFNIGGMKLPFGIFPELEKSRYQGNLYGGGVSIGYSWIISKRWNIEAEAGFGYARVVYDKYPCRHCSLKSISRRYNYIGPTKAAINLIYLF